MSATHEVRVRSRRVIKAAAARADFAARGCDPQVLASVFPGGNAVELTLAVKLLQADTMMFWEATEVARLLVHTHATPVPLLLRLPSLFEQDWTLTPAQACFAFVALDSESVVILVPAEFAPPGRLRKWQAFSWPGQIDACLCMFPPPAQAPSLDSGTVLWPHADGQDFALSRATLSPDGLLLATGGEHGTVALWQTTDLREVFRLLDDFDEDSDPTPHVQFSRDGKTLAWSSLDGGGLRLRAVDPPSETVRVDGEFYLYEFCPDGRTLVAQLDDIGLALVETATGRPIRPLAASTDRINFVTARREPLLAVTTGDELRVLSLPDGAPLWAVPLPPSQGNPAELAFSHADDRLAVGRADGVITVHDARTGEVHSTIPTSREELTGKAITIVMSLDFAPDGEFLAAAICERYPLASRTQVWIVRVADGAVLRTLGAPVPAIFRVQFAPGPVLLIQGHEQLTLHRIPAVPTA